MYCMEASFDIEHVTMVEHMGEEQHDAADAVAFRAWCCCGWEAEPVTSWFFARDEAFSHECASDDEV